MMAKKFRFKLEAVFKLRERERDVQRRKVAEVVRAVTNAEQRVESLSDSLRGTLDARRDVQSAESIDVGMLRSQRFYQSWLHGTILEANATVADRKQELAVERASLGHVNARFKSLEKLKERKWQRHLEEAKREELAMFDEIGVQRFRIASRDLDDEVGVGVAVGVAAEVVIV